MIIVQIQPYKMRLRNLVRDFGDDHTGSGQQFAAEQFSSLHMEGVVDWFGWDKMRYYDGNDLVGLPGRQNLIDIDQQRLQEEPIW